MTLEDKLKAVVIHSMLISTETFTNFCKLINGFPEEKIESTFDNLSLEEMENVLSNVKSVANELDSVVISLHSVIQEMKEKEELLQEIDKVDDHGS